MELRPARIKPNMTSSNPNVATASENQIPQPERSTSLRDSADSPNMRLAVSTPSTAPVIWAATYHAAVGRSMDPVATSVSVTAGLKCEPETRPRATIIAPSTPAVATAFCRIWSP